VSSLKHSHHVQSIVTSTNPLEKAGIALVVVVKSLGVFTEACSPCALFPSTLFLTSRVCRGEVLYSFRKDEADPISRVPFSFPHFSSGLNSPFY
jgi:hypothetical protein